MPTEIKMDSRPRIQVSLPYKRLMEAVRKPAVKKTIARL